MTATPRSPTDLAARQLAASFAPGELAIVCSHYDVGVISMIRPLAGGSASSPKVRIDTASGSFLLKRREPGRDDPFMVAFSHSIQIHLASKGFPLARLIGTRGENNSMLQLRGRIYEMFDFTSGERFAGSLGQTARAGATLAMFHHGVADHASDWTPARGSFHHPGGIDEWIARALARVGEESRTTLDRLRALYLEAAGALERFGFSRAPETLIHGDWHPGNMLFAGDRVLTVLDFDSVRLSPRIADVASGALQFSIVGGGDPERWPPEADLPRLHAFLDGYASGAPISEADRSLIPALMIEALITEALGPIASSGRFGERNARDVLEAVSRKGAWIRDNAASIARATPRPPRPIGVARA